ncbi:hypothetical protein N4G70_23795 [Streptomyces sp. ASQP_92]|uniref:hypothetical protein n=1 Tax=Streptomyces sp. ASQP_92 TaxID=2979116 RepID=UPI0021C1AB30|nr:hypothetical protein [Streptomyces sp. ASQP_92]MCT9091874.1 hypothetical protein [Streptomyces sp. ASQP_92]
MPGIDECLLEAMLLPGALGAGVADWTSGLALGAIGQSPGGDHEATAAETAELARMAAEHPGFGAASSLDASALGAPALDSQGLSATGPPVEDLIITTRTAYHLLCFVETAFDSSVFLHLWLDRDEGNLALARLRLRDLAERLVL